MEVYKKIKALGTEIEFYLNSEERHNFKGDLLELKKIVNDFEKSFSRFILTSELSMFNKASAPFLASGELIDILLIARDFYHSTAGIFNPSILPSLERVGYDKSFDSIIPNDSRGLALLKKVNNNFDLLNINTANNLITKPNNLKIDLGGIGKGYLVDLLATNLIEKGYKDFWVSAGGDMYLSGLTKDKKEHQVGVWNPLKPNNDIAKLIVSQNHLAIATSGITKRQWRRKDEIYNHMIDPRAGKSVSNDLLSVTVISDKAVKSDVFAKTVLILGKERGLEFLNKQENAEALIIDKKLEISMSLNMNKYLIKI